MAAVLEAEVTTDTHALTEDIVVIPGDVICPSEGFVRCVGIACQSPSLLHGMNELSAEVMESLRDRECLLRAWLAWCTV